MPQPQLRKNVKKHICKKHICGRRLDPQQPTSPITSQLVGLEEEEEVKFGLSILCPAEYTDNSVNQGFVLCRVEIRNIHELNN